MFFYLLLPFIRLWERTKKKMSSISFRILALISLLVVIVSIPIAVIVVEKLFPDYIQGIKVLILLLLAMTLPLPIGSLINFIIAANKSLSPFFILSLLNGSLVLLTSFILIPRIGIMGGAISQVIVYIISSSCLCFKDFNFYFGLKKRAYYCCL